MDVMSASDRERKAAMQRMKRLALGLLVLVTIVFLLARWQEEHHQWLGFVRAFAEAAMVGALADWFAVTALFRHPLGIPIPHTAIIPHRKDQIGASLGDFVQQNFLTREVLDDRLANAHVGRRLGTWLSEPANATKAGEGVADALRGSLEVLDDRDVSTALEGLIERKIRTTPVAPLMGRALDVAMEGGHHQRLLDAVLTGLAGFLDDNRTTFRTRLEQESPWWIPEPVDDRIFEKIYTAVHRFIGDVGSDDKHEVREAIDQRVLAFAGRLRADPELVAKGEELKNELLAHRDVRAWLQSLWGEVKRSTLTATDDPESELRQRIDRSLVHLGERLRDEPELQRKVDEWVQRAAGYVVDHYRGEVAEIISSTVQKWDGKATAERLELQVGRDLQFIRINGTIVGGLAGVVIYTVSRFLF
ncbi:MAG: DUF445 domain-containing protein [Actinobacteria bacterium]|jgi:uncharacterized membrane-anchored protein YjiN (DUF445 family)|nr:DUF445 domain-containing protein [Acidimicrobiaceae bacterium]MBP6488132.1 DUF445 domain-containing protein [Ilumatobacteraceae bacterium]NMD25195.1 DUF445 domain-containing protein [Actinomycetota bacterium]MBK9970090.1 DUF445 domain-containing protein [Acidimicrobiaceae bacterium]MBP7890826.1 DUF445 domain-containing protein [Ilumatobacteraceae bacterium]